MSTKRVVAAVALVVLCALLALASGTPKSLSATGFVGRSGETTVIVDADPALHVGARKFIPLLVWVGHREAKALEANRTSFTLLDPLGGRHALPDYATVRRDYGSVELSADRSRIQVQEMHYEYGNAEFFYGRRIPRVAFFPDPSGTEVLYDTVEMPARTWFRALLYFPNPAGRDRGVYTLLYEDPRGAARVEVPFTVNWTK